MPTGDVPYPALPPSPAERLLKKARTRFPDLTPAEEKMVRAAAEGELVEIGTDSFINLLESWFDFPAWFRLCNSQSVRAVIAPRLNIDSSRLTIRAAVLRWLCTHPTAVKLIHARGVQIYGAVITGEIDFRQARIPVPLLLAACQVCEPISALGAHFASLDLNGCAGQGLTADGARFDGWLNLRDGTLMAGEVRLLGATIGGNLDCIGGRFENINGHALSADLVRVRGTVNLSNGFHAKGEVRLLGATIGGNLACKGGQFENPIGRALSADRLRVRGDINLVQGFHAKGEVRLLGATIGSDLDCRGGRFVNSGGVSLSADGVRVRGSVSLREGFHAQGEVRLIGASIGGDLNCTGGRFKNPEAVAIAAESAHIAGNLFLSGGFQAQGGVVLGLATIGGVFDMRDWRCKDVKNPKKTDTFIQGRLVLSHCQLGTLHDGGGTIECLIKTKTILFLHGFIYSTLGQDAPMDATMRLAWLRLHPGKDFTPQPYGHLARVLDALGHADDARAIRVAAAKDAANHQLLQSLSSATNSRSQRLKARTRWLGQWFLGLLLGHGYHPLRPLWGMLFFLLLGWFVFSIGQAHMRPSSDQVVTSTEYLRDGSIPPEYPRLQPLVYSADLLLPIIDLDQANFWRPYPEPPPCGSSWFTVTAGECLRAYAWIHVTAAWTFSTFLIIGLTGLVKKELPEADSPNT
jgi:hypothetical protein